MPELEPQSLICAVGIQVGKPADVCDPQVGFVRRTGEWSILRATANEYNGWTAGNDVARMSP